MTPTESLMVAGVAGMILTFAGIAGVRWYRSLPRAVSTFLGLRLYGRISRKDARRWVEDAEALAYNLGIYGSDAGLWRGNRAFLAEVRGAFVTLRPEPWEHKGERVSGLTWPGGVEVAYTPHPTDGALAHELVHLWAERTGLGIDYDHADGTGHWTPEVDRVIARVRGAG